MPLPRQGIFFTGQQDGKTIAYAGTRMVGNMSDSLVEKRII
jgi:hypothetical protein